MKAPRTITMRVTGINPLPIRLDHASPSVADRGGRARREELTGAFVLEAQRR
jgi:hypothetical protein